DEAPETPEPLTVACAGVSQDENLVTRALLAIENATGWVFSGHVTVRKNIPTGAGLGGGSSDGAAALRAGAEMVAEAGGPRLTPSQLHGLARGLGADVPFFLDPMPALARGVGDLLEPLELPPLPLVLLLPESPLSTADVYRAFDGLAAGPEPAATSTSAAAAPVASSDLAAGSGSAATPEPAAVPGPADTFEERFLAAERGWRGLSSAWSSGACGVEEVVLEAARLLRNDLEEASLQLRPGLASTRAALDAEEVSGTLMSGSGPTLFGLCASSAVAQAVAQRLCARGYDARAVVTGGAPAPRGPLP
ncbi:MAG TPA: hypothetical protein VFD74_05740, partial [Thermoleophilia bacterium]|nr:hypothetical protein [Thermoleophilia bacterium]